MPITDDINLPALRDRFVSAIMTATNDDTSVIGSEERRRYSARDAVYREVLQYLDRQTASAPVDSGLGSVASDQPADANAPANFILVSLPDNEDSSHAVQAQDDAELIREQVVARMFMPPFQSRVQPWMVACFGAEISADKIERNHRFLEEALELVQSNGCTRDEAHQLVDYVYGRDQGDINQEVGGVMVTLAALCLATGLDMHAAGETELARVWTKVEQIRAKQAAKPKHSPLPMVSPSEAPAPRWRHKIRRSEYTEIARGMLQVATNDPTVGDTIVAYRGTDGRVWFREVREFEDGRFVRVDEECQP